MKTIKIAFFAILSVISFAANADRCSDNSTGAFNIAQCRAKAWTDKYVQYSELATRLYVDQYDLGLTSEERQAVLKYTKEVDADVKKHCGNGDNDCRLNAYSRAVNELSTFENQKKAEKQKRMAQVARPSLSSSLNQQQTKKNYSSYTPEELRKLQEANTKKLQQMEQSNSEEFEGE